MRIGPGLARRGAFFDQAQIARIAITRTRATLRGQLNDGRRSLPLAQFDHEVLCRIQNLAGKHGIAIVDCTRKIADRPAESLALAQHDGMLCKRRHLRPLCTQSCGNPLAGCLLQIIARQSIVSSVHRTAAQIAEHGACLHRRQLILVAQQHQPRIGRQCQHQCRHHFHVHHGGLVDNQHVQIERMTGGIPEVARIRCRAQQRMQCPRRAHAFGQAGKIQMAGKLAGKFCQRTVDGLLQARRSLAGGCCKGDAQALGCRIQREQHRQQARRRIRLAGAGPTRNDRESPLQCEGAGALLPIDAIGRGIGRSGPVEQLIQPCACTRHINHYRLRSAQPHGGRDGALVVPVTSQIQPGLLAGFVEHQRGDALALRAGVGRAGVAR